MWYAADWICPLSTKCCAGKYKAAPQKIAGSAAEATVIAEYLSGIGIAVYALLRRPHTISR